MAHGHIQLPETFFTYVKPANKGCNSMYKCLK